MSEPEAPSITPNKSTQWGYILFWHLTLIEPLSDF